LFFAITFLITYVIATFITERLGILLGVILGLLIYVPITEIYFQIVNYFLIKTVKPTIIPKINLSNGLSEESATMVVIPTIVDSCEKAVELVKKLEVYYLANKTENMYFAVLADCTKKNVMNDEKDKQIIGAGLKEIERLNQKYNADFPKFHFLYRKRKWCATEKAYLGWERKRGLLMQFNDFLVSSCEYTRTITHVEKSTHTCVGVGVEGDPTTNAKHNNIGAGFHTQPNRNHHQSDFLYNSLEEVRNKIPKIKYIITLDSDTNLTLNSGLELVGAMEHILNKPVVKNKVVVDGYGIIQPRIGVDISIMNKSIFTEIFSQKGGVDLYSKAVSDVYQDNFGEAIFTGKGIYDLQVFNQLLSKTVPENTVLSHDLLEGCYLKCGLATDILLLDGYPSKYNSYMKRNHRWIRGDWQIISWLLPRVFNENRKKVKNPLNKLSRFKIFENLRRSLLPVMALILLFINYKLAFILGLICISMPTILDIANYIVFIRRDSQVKQINFSYNISGIKQSILRGILDIVLIADRATVSANAIIKTLYRLRSKHNLLEWTTAEEAEKLQKTTLTSYYKTMWISVILGVLMVCLLGYANIVLGLLWIFAPYIMWYISKSRQQEAKLMQLNEDEKKYIIDVARKTWGYFKQYMNEEGHYLPPDNYQEGKKINKRTSSTNIGLGILTVVSAYDFKFIKIEEALDLIEKILYVIDGLPKWNGHLYNWYNTEDLSLMIPRYISTVDSGNFVGYLYVLKQFLTEVGNRRSEVGCRGGFHIRPNKIEQCRNRDKPQKRRRGA